MKSSIKILSTRWDELVRKSDDLTNKYDEQYRAWLTFDSELNSFREQILNEFEQRMQTINANDPKKFFDLNRIQTFINELKVNFHQNCQFNSLFSSHSMKIFVNKHRIMLDYKSNSMI